MAMPVGAAGAALRLGGLSWLCACWSNACSASDRSAACWGDRGPGRQQVSAGKAIAGTVAQRSTSVWVFVNFQVSTRKPGSAAHLQLLDSVCQSLLLHTG